MENSTLVDYGILRMTVPGGKRGVNINRVLLKMCMKLMTKARNVEIVAFHAAGYNTVACVLLAV